MCQSPLCAERQMCAFLHHDKWLCRLCHDREDQRQAAMQAADEKAALAAEHRRYLALPELTAQELRDHVLGKAVRRDGVDCQMWSWTNSDVAQVVAPLVETDVVLLKPWGNPTVLTAAGHKVDLRQIHRDRSGGGGVHREIAGPADRFNQPEFTQGVDQKQLEALAMAITYAEVAPQYGPPRAIPPRPRVTSGSMGTVEFLTIALVLCGAFAGLVWFLMTVAGG